METLRHYFNRVITRDEAESIIFLEIILGIIISTVSLIFFADITNAVLNKQTVAFDNTVSGFVFLFRTDWLTNVMKVVSIFGEQVLVVGSIAVVIILTSRKHRRESFIFTVLLLLGLATTEILKLLYSVPRPRFYALVVENSYSYPSGHALNSFLFYSTIAFFVYHFTRRKIESVIIAAFLAAVILLIGFSRIYLGVHHPSDVIAGYIAGFWLFVTIILVDKTIVFLRLMRESSKSLN